MADQEIERIQFSLPTEVDISFDAEDVVTRLKPLEVHDLIVEMDEEVGRWEHTLLLHHHFQEQFELIKAKRPELAAMSVQELEDSLVESSKDDGLTTTEENDRV